MDATIVTQLPTVPDKEPRSVSFFGHLQAVVTGAPGVSPGHDAAKAITAACGCRFADPEPKLFPQSLPRKNCGHKDCDTCGRQSPPP